MKWMLRNEVFCEHRGMTSIKDYLLRYPIKVFRKENLRNRESPTSRTDWTIDTLIRTHCRVLRYMYNKRSGSLRLRLQRRIERVSITLICTCGRYFSLHCRQSVEKLDFTSHLLYDSLIALYLLQWWLCSSSQNNKQLTLMSSWRRTDASNLREWKRK